jgi:hypothetical protein
MGYLGEKLKAIKHLGSKAKGALKHLGKKAVEVVAKVIDTPLLKDFSSQAKAFLERNGEGIINAIQVCRTPLSQALNKLIDVVTSGGWEEAKKSLNMDKLYHTFMRISYDDKVVILEKNDRPQFTPSKPNVSRKDEERIDVQVRPGLTINKMMENAIKRAGNTRFFVYDAFSTNCQCFVKDCLSASDQINYSAQVSAFTMQDVKSLVEKQPWYLRVIAKGATDLVNKAKHAYEEIPDVAEPERDQ